MGTYGLDEHFRFFIVLKETMAADPGGANPGGTPSAQPNQSEESGSPRQPGASGNQGRRRQGTRQGQQRDQAPRSCRSSTEDVMT
jgi:hypothetical protein